MIQITKEQITISQKNKDKAWAYFVSIGEIPEDAKPYSYVLHHVDKTLRHTDIERYIQWNPEDLVVMDYGEHSSLHNKDRVLSEYTKNKISTTLKGNIPWNKGLTKETDERVKKNAESTSKANIGKHLSEETKKKMSISLKGVNKGKHSNKGQKWKLVDGKRVYYKEDAA